ncbi:MAG: CsgG/HfaB family protein [Candidatus Zapsychrus exili]|nr:CsgG/HfaB family protein [Candidatus Zapsychrus exili]
MKRLVVVLVFSALFCMRIVSVQAGSKVTVGVGKIEYRATLSEADKNRHAYGRGSVAAENTKAFVDMLSTALIKAKKFRVIERERLGDLIQEQSLGESGMILDEETAHKLGTVHGIDYMILGAITQYGIDKTGIGTGGKLGFNLGLASEKARMSVDMRIIEVETGAVVIAETVEEIVSGSKSLRSEYVALDSGGGQLLSDVMRKTSNSVARLIVSKLFPVKVVNISSSGVIMLNYGSGFLNEKGVFDVFSQGEEIVDPDTGEVLGSEEEKVGRIEITSVHEKFSKAKALEGTDKIGKGMICRSVSKKTLAKEQKTRKKTKRKKLKF